VSPKISIIIPSFNQVQFLARALESLEKQKYRNLEVVVIDGASTDGTVDLLSSSPTVSKWVSEPDLGQTNALNKGFKLATGEVFGWLNCDERYRDGSLHLVAKAFAEDPGLDMVFGHRIVVDTKGTEIGREKMPAIHPLKYALYAFGLLCSDATFWRRDLHLATGELDDVRYPRYGMDFDWLCRLSLNVKHWKRIDEFLSEFTEYDGRISKNVPEMAHLGNEIRRDIRRMARVRTLQVLLYGPLYFILVRYSRFGWRGLIRPPTFRGLLRIAGFPTHLNHGPRQL
jgi:glycosyltransferase involved in cell wall biosynthesis